VQNAQARHFQKWPILGISGPAPEVGAIATTYNAELDTLKAWINLRIQWLDDNIPGICNPFTHMDEQISSFTTLSYYPNPGTGIIHFDGFLCGSAPFWLNFYDGAGKKIDSMEMQAGDLQFSYHLKGKGIYYFTLINNDGLIRSGKLIVL
jgi:hypothetical protein